MAESSNKRLAGKVTIVTGSGRGIGRCEALLMAQQGAKVVVSDIGSDSEGGSTAANVADEIRAAGGEAVPTTDSVVTMEGATHGRHGSSILRPPGHPGQQCGFERWQPDRQAHRGGVGSRGGQPSQIVLCDDQVRGAGVQAPRRRRDRQHRFRSRVGNDLQRRLFLRQGRDRRTYTYGGS